MAHASSSTPTSNESNSNQRVCRVPKEICPQSLTSTPNNGSLSSCLTQRQVHQPPMHLRNGNVVVGPHEVDQITLITTDSERKCLDGSELPMSLAALLDVLKQLQNSTQDVNNDHDDDSDNGSVDSLKFYRRSGRLLPKNE